MNCLGVVEGPIPEPSVTVRRYGPFGNLFFRPMIFKTKGSMTSGHAHKFDHVTYVTAGSVRVKAREVNTQTNETFGPVVDRIYVSPACVLIKKNWAHEIEALEENTRADCIFALRDHTGEVTDQYDGSLENYS